MIAGNILNLNVSYRKLRLITDWNSESFYIVGKVRKKTQVNRVQPEMYVCHLGH